MPMKSKAQRAYLHANKLEAAKKLEKETTKGKNYPQRLRVKRMEDEKVR